MLGVTIYTFLYGQAPLDVVERVVLALFCTPIACVPALPKSEQRVGQIPLL